MGAQLPPIGRDAFPYGESALAAAYRSPQSVTHLTRPELWPPPLKPEVPLSTHDISEERAAAYIAVQGSQEFGELRRKFRRFVFPMTGLFLAWYFLYVLSLIHI